MDPNFEYKQNQHTQTRAVGQFFMGPIQRDGYDNRVLELTANEVEFKTSEEAKKFMNYQTRRFAPARQLCNSRRMKMISSDDQ